MLYLKSVYQYKVYNKTILSYRGQPWPKHQPAHCPVFQYGWVPSKKQCRCAQTSNDTYAKYWLLSFLLLRAKSLQ